MWGIIPVHFTGSCIGGGVRMGIFQYKCPIVRENYKDCWPWLKLSNVQLTKKWCLERYIFCILIWEVWVPGYVVSKNIYHYKEITLFFIWNEGYSKHYINVCKNNLKPNILRCISCNVYPFKGMSLWCYDNTTMFCSQVPLSIQNLMWWILICGGFFVWKISF